MLFCVVFFSQWIFSDVEKMTNPQKEEIVTKTEKTETHTARLWCESKSSRAKSVNLVNSVTQIKQPPKSGYKHLIKEKHIKHECPTTKNLEPF